MKGSGPAAFISQNRSWAHNGEADEDSGLAHAGDIIGDGQL
jgi:hypothetical protein